MDIELFSESEYDPGFKLTQRSLHKYILADHNPILYNPNQYLMMFFKILFLSFQNQKK